jgi:hypothetical protein
MFLVLAWAVGWAHWHGGPLMLAGAVGLAAVILIVGSSYEQGRLSNASLIGAANDALADFVAAAQAGAMAAETPTMRLAGGGPMDGMTVPHPIKMISESTHARIVAFDEHDDPLGVYETSPTDPNVMIWIPATEEDDAS